MIYEFVKILHVLSACLLFGTGLGTAVYMFVAHRTKNVPLIATALRQVVKGDWCFTLTSGFMQLLTGLWMVHLHHLSYSLLWVWGSICGYIIAGVCWLPVVYLQIQLRDLAENAVKKCKPLPSSYYRKFNQWFWLGWPAFISLIGVFYLMVNRPTHF